MTRKWIIVTVVVAVAFSLATAAFGYAKLGSRAHMMGFMAERSLAELEARLNLNSDQSARIREILKGARDQGFDQFASGAPDRQALAREIFKDNPSQEEIQKRVAALEAQHAKMLNLVVQTGAEVNSVLTPDQRAEMQKIIDEKAKIADKMRERFKEDLQSQDGK